MDVREYFSQIHRLPRGFLEPELTAEANRSWRSILPVPDQRPRVFQKNLLDALLDSARDQPAEERLWRYRRAYALGSTGDQDDILGLELFETARSFLVGFDVVIGKPAAVELVEDLVRDAEALIRTIDRLSSAEATIKSGEFRDTVYRRFDQISRTHPGLIPEREYMW